MSNPEIKMYDADSMEYTGSILVDGFQWEYRDVDNEDLIRMTSGMPLKGVLACLIYFNIVYDIIA